MAAENITEFGKSKANHQTFLPLSQIYKILNICIHFIGGHLAKFNFLVQIIHTAKFANVFHYTVVNITGHVIIVKCCLFSLALEHVV